MQNRRKNVIQSYIQQVWQREVLVRGAQIPGSDNAVITPIQLTMTISLGRVFGKSLSEASAKAALASVAAATVGRTASQVLVGWIPGIGNAINATTAAGITEAMGWLLAKEFDEGLL